jgi:ATP-dependent DNA helicase RecG
MNPSLQKLQKIFKLEAERGYDNRAVLGGLDRILESWEAEARLDGLPEEIIQAVGIRLRDYPRLSESSRAEALEGLWRRLQRETEAPNDLLISPTPKEEGEKIQETQVERAEETPSQEEDDSAVEIVEEAPEEKITASPDTPESHPAEEKQIQPTKPAEKVEEPPAALNAPVTVLPGIGARHAQTLSRLGLNTLGDMLRYYPRRYDDYTQLKPINRLHYGDEVTVIATVQSVAVRPIRSGRAQLVEAIVSDDTAALRISWFNQPWVAKRVRKGMNVALSGKIEQYLGRLVMNSPEIEPLEQQQLSTNRIVPVYPLTAQITQRWLRRLMNQVVAYWAPRVRDPLPERVRNSANLVNISSALIQIHFPDTWDLLKAARHRLAFDEIFMLQLGVLRQKQTWQERSGRVFDTPDDWLRTQVSRLPFPLTGAQQHALDDIRKDLVSGHPMNRLLQGDVGSGKTIVAALAVAMVTRHGAQAALMAPTSILAEQHYKNLKKTLCTQVNPEPALISQVQEEEEAPPEPEAASPAGIDETPVLLLPPPLQEAEIRLLVGATPEAEKREILAGLADGTIKLVIGTHALIEGPVAFSDLELTIVDEQHRFGVEQRATLRSKGTNPHLLVMTATPIPRSLALTIYGDLDLSVMDEMPPGRQDVSTYVLTPRERERAYGLIRSQIEQGHQAFIIYPLVEESDSSDAKAAVEEHARLQKEIFPNLSVGLLHGRLKAEEKENVMARFHDGEFQILVATSVVEVGVDVPNATVMLVEGANRFGLAQLHQFRGRVGRGSAKAYCLLIPENSDEVENERLKAMTETNDGFLLAERDLEQRGPGEFLGTRQSGLGEELKLANLSDIRLIEKARSQAQALFRDDPEMSKPEHQLLANTLQRFWGDAGGDIS